ncbi:MAG: LysM peptidoglycan-binding domain-containing protein [Oligoflexales bacterium]
MRLRRLRGFWVMSLLLFGLMAVSCSSQQQDQEGLESSEYGEQDQEDIDQQEGQEDYQEENEQGEGEYDNSQLVQQGDLQGLDGGNNLLGNEGGQEGNYGEGGDNDLANIINEMNQLNDESGGNVATGNIGGAFDQAGDLESNQAYSDGGFSSAPSSGGGGVVTGSAGTAAGPGLPELGSKLAYIVVRGDTLGKISNRIYGSSGKWRELASNSGIENPSMIFPGDVVYYQLTSEAVAFASDYENLEKEEITVEKGETLRTIASKTYGDPETWKSIWRQNGQIMDPNKIEAGTKLYVMSKTTLAALKNDNFGNNSMVQDDSA